MLARNYNSGASSDNGWFGYGWSTSFEARLTVMPEGSVLVRNLLDRKHDRYALAGKENLIKEGGITAGLTAAGHIVEARTGRDASVATYRYADCGNLVAASAQREHRYNYNAAQKMTRGESADNQANEMQYDAQGRIAVVVSPDGTKNSYEYQSDLEQPDLHMK